MNKTNINEIPTIFGSFKKIYYYNLGQVDKEENEEIIDIFQKINKKSKITKSKALKLWSNIIKEKKENFIEILLQRYNIIYQQNILTENDLSVISDLQNIITKLVEFHPMLFNKYIASYFSTLYFLSNYSNHNIRTIAKNDLNKIMGSDDNISNMIINYMDNLLYFIKPILLNNSDYIKNLDNFDNLDNLDSLFKHLLGTALMTIKSSFKVLGKNNLNTSKIFLNWLFENNKNNKNIINTILNDDNIIIKYTLIELINEIFINNLDENIDKKSLSFVMKNMLSKIDTEDLNFQKKIWENNFLKKIVMYLDKNKILDKEILHNKIKNIIKLSAMGLGEIYFNHLIEFLSDFNQFKKGNDYNGNLKTMIDLVQLYFKSSLDDINSHNMKIYYDKGFEILDILKNFESNDNIKFYEKNINLLINNLFLMYLQLNNPSQVNLNVLGVNPLKHFPIALINYLKKDSIYKSYFNETILALSKKRDIFKKHLLLKNILNLLTLLEKNNLNNTYIDIIEFYLEIIIDNINKLNFDNEDFTQYDNNIINCYIQIVNEFFYKKRSLFKKELVDKFINTINNNLDLVFNKKKLNNFLIEQKNTLVFNKFFIKLILFIKDDIKNEEIFKVFMNYKAYINEDTNIYNFCLITNSNFDFNNYYKKNKKEIKLYLNQNFDNIIRYDSDFLINDDIFKFMLDKFLNNNEILFYETILINLKNKNYRELVVTEISTNLNKYKKLLNLKVKLLILSYNYDNLVENLFNIIFEEKPKISNYSIDSIHFLTKNNILKLLKFTLRKFLNNKKLINDKYQQFNNFLENLIDKKLLKIDDYKELTVKYLKKKYFDFNYYHNSEIFMIFFENVCYKNNLDIIYKELINLYISEKNTNYLTIFTSQFYFYNTYDNDLHIYYKNIVKKYFINYFMWVLKNNYNKFIELINEVFLPIISNDYYIFLLEELLLNLFKDENFKNIKIKLYDDIFDKYFKNNKVDLLNNNFEKNLIFIKLFNLYDNSYFLQTYDIDSSFIINKYHLENFDKNLISLAHINLKLRESDYKEVKLDQLLNYIDALEENNLKNSFKIQYYNILFKENDIELISKYIEDIDTTLGKSINILTKDDKISIFSTQFGDIIFINLLKIVARLINNLDMFSEEFNDNVFNKITNISLNIVDSIFNIDYSQNTNIMVNPINLIFEIAETITKFALKDKLKLENSEIFGLLKSKCIPIKSSIYFLIKQYNVLNPTKFYEIDKDEKIEKYFSNDMRNYLYQESEINNEFFLYYLLNWNITLNRVENNSDIQKDISEIFEENDKFIIIYINTILNYILNKRLDEKLLIKKIKQKKINEIDFNWIDKDYLDLNFEIIFNSIYLLCCHFPKTLRSYEIKCQKKYSNILNLLLKVKISALLLEREITQMEINQYKWDQDELKINIIKDTKDIRATYIKDETEIRVNLKMPDNYPLGVIDITSNNASLLNKKRRSMNLIMKTLLLNHNDSLINVILLWKNNIDAQFEGQDECLICFYIIDSKTKQLPNKSCRTCRKKFHSYCIEKWFRTSQKSECPACKSQFL